MHDATELKTLHFMVKGTYLYITFYLITKHLIDDFILHGSLISHSMFSLESLLGFLSKLVNGPRGLSKQYAKRSIFYNYLFKILK